MTFREFDAVVEGFYRREDQSWRRTRLIAYTDYRMNAKDPVKPEEWLPLNGDPKPDFKKFMRDAKRLNDKAKVLWAS